MESDRKDYAFFWLENFSASTQQSIENNKEERPEIEKKEMIYFGEGIYDNLCDLDFRKFSFSTLKEIAKEEGVNGDIRNIIEAIQEFIDSYDVEPYRFKKLRIYFFNSLFSRGCSYYNPHLYLKIQKEMVRVLNKAEKLIQDKGKKRLSKTMDSITLQASYEEGKKIQEEINEELPEEINLRYDYFNRVVKFRNIISYRNGDEIRIKKTNATDYDDMKKKLCLVLSVGDKETARKIIKEYEPVGDDLRKDYFGSLGDMLHGKTDN